MAALEHAPAGIYNIVDDEPMTRYDLQCILASAVGKGKVRRIPSFVTRIVAGTEVNDVLSRSHRVTNRLFRHATNWTPQIRNIKDGWEILSSILKKHQ